ncbi:MAG: tetratricopeptide repeat protein, partial [Thermomicrobiales bacterium]|nr:tetratricopeptide repeat protein [Thermomicrobiales bacterium]
EGSTRLWESAPDAMSRALQRHDDLMRTAISQHGGRVFKTAGDAFCAVFPTATGAVGAAIAAQVALLCEPWDPRVVIRVRMGIHTEPAETRGGDFFGPALNRVARLLATAHGEQIVLSRAARLAAEPLPTGVTVRDLGEYALKDLAEAERIFQVDAPGLRTVFPALRTPERLLRNVPAPATPLLGRDEAVREVRTHFGLAQPGDTESRSDAPARLVTLTGPGGTGKTRLGLHLARELGLELDDGAVFVPLAAVTDPSLAPAAVASALDVAPGGGDSVRQAVLDHLRDRRLILVLDNVEQVMGVADLAAEILAQAPRVMLLVTSRERLNIRGEREYALPPLALPGRTGSDGERREAFPELVAVAQSPAVQLFLDRAQRVKPDLALTEENAGLIAEICRSLDGLPLALELAAARARLLTPAAMLERLDHRLDLLSKGARDLPDRQRTMRAAIAWSYGLLSPEEQQAFAGLGVFAGGVSLADAEQVLFGECGIEADLDVFESLADKSLLRIVGDDDEPRLMMFETIRDYALECLAGSPLDRELRERHAARYLALAEEAEPHLGGKLQRVWLRRLDREQANLRAAIAWLRQSEHPQDALRLGAALWRFWWLRGDTQQDRVLLESLLVEVPGADRQLRAQALNGAGVLADSAGDWEGATRLHTESLRIFRELGDPHGVAWSLNNLGVVELNQGHLEAAQALLEENLAMAEAAGADASIATALNDLGQIAHYQGDHDRAIELLTRGLERFRALGDETHMARALNNLGTITGESGDLETACALLAESLALHRAVGDRQGIASTLNNLAQFTGQRGDVTAARAMFHESYALARESGNRLYAAISLDNLAALLLPAGEHAAAARRYQEAFLLYVAVSDEQGVASSLSGLAVAALEGGYAATAAQVLGALSASSAAEHAEGEALASAEERLRALLGAQAYANAHALGAARPAEQVVTQVVRELGGA